MHPYVIMTPQSPMQPWKCDRLLAADNKNALKSTKVRNSRLEFLTWAATIKVDQCLQSHYPAAFLRDRSSYLTI